MFVSISVIHRNVVLLMECYFSMEVGRRGRPLQGLLPIKYLRDKGQIPT